MYNLFTKSIIQLSSRLQLVQEILVAPRLFPQSEPVLHENPLENVLFGKLAPKLSVSYFCICVMSLRISTFICVIPQHTNDVLSAFSTIKLEERRHDSKPKGEEAMEVEDSGAADINPVQQYFAKYLTSQNLLELQLGDSNFRRYVLIQFLIMFQYLEAPVKFKQYSNKSITFVAARV